MSSNDCSLLCSLQLLTLKYAGLHERDLSIHSYQEKPDSGKTSSIIPFLHHSSSNSEKNKKRQFLYYDEFHDYFMSRSLPFHLSNRIFENLHDKLVELDQLLNNLNLIRILWLRETVIILVFSNGTLVFLHIDDGTRTLKHLTIDKTSLAKKFQITSTISDFYLNSYGFYVIYESLSKIDLFRFQKPIRSFHSKFVLSNESTDLVSEELPPYSNNIPVRRWFDVNHDAGTLTVWWSMISESLSTTRPVNDGKTRFNALAVVFPLSNPNEKAKTHSVATETTNPFFCSATPSGLTTVELNERPAETSFERRYDLSLYYYENFRSVPLRLVHVPSLSASILYVIRSSTFTIVVLTDGTLISIDEINYVERKKNSTLSRHLTGLWWIIENLLFALADKDGSIVFYDVALNPIWPILSSNEKLNFHEKLNSEQHVVGISLLVSAEKNRNPSNLTVVLQFSSGGPVGLLNIHFPFKNVHSLLKFYLNSNNYSYVIDLFWCLDWSRQDHDARLAFSYICQDLFRHLTATTSFYLEQMLRTFYSPLRAISDASILRNRSFVNQIATRFFYYLLREKLYSQALQLAKHLDSRTIYLDLYFACDHDQEKTIMNVCAQYLSTPLDQEFDEQSDLSVTSSDEEPSQPITARKVYPQFDRNIYADINEILSSAIEEYQLDENIHKFLAERLHVS